ncbi:universal stress protein [Phenylobacterium immobile]|uniref:universal stress protein n=1 Tax=Phenylobacterium immobile TaxID=21 RepID=UPI000AC6F550|nr:universal stress protein [Phenylobacterium immobile]
MPIRDVVLQIDSYPEATSTEATSTEAIEQAARFTAAIASGRRIGEVLDDYVTECGSDLLVMGAYGRSRVREFILGGGDGTRAARSQDAAVPVSLNRGLLACRSSASPD